MTLPSTGAITTAQISQEIYGNSTTRINTNTDPYLAAKKVGGRIDFASLRGWTHRNKLTITLGNAGQSVTVSPSSLPSFAQTYSNGHSTYRPGATDVEIVVPAGVLILGGTPLAPALVVEGWSAGDNVAIRIAGRVQGRGGAGGYYFPGVLAVSAFPGATPDPTRMDMVRTTQDYWVAPQSGGIALECRCPVASLHVLAGGILAGGGAGAVGLDHLCHLVYGYMTTGGRYYIRGGGGGAGHGAAFLHSGVMTVMRKSAYHYVPGFQNYQFFKTQQGQALDGSSISRAFIAYATYRGPDASTLDAPGKALLTWGQKYFTLPTHTDHVETNPDVPGGSWDAIAPAATWLHSEEIICGHVVGPFPALGTTGGALGSTSGSGSATGGSSITGRSKITSLTINGAVYGSYAG